MFDKCNNLKGLVNKGYSSSPIQLSTSEFMEEYTDICSYQQLDANYYLNA